MAKQTFTTGQVLTAAQMTSLQQTAMGGGSPSVKTTSYILVAADAGTVIQMNSASSTTITVNTSLFSAGDSVQIQNIGAGTCTITAGTATVNSAGSLAVTQYDGGFLYFSSASSALWFDYTQAGTTSPLTTKGDLYTRTSSADARLPVGTNGYTLVADSAQATGLKWQAPAAGGMTVLASGTLSGATLTLDTISQDYVHLQLILTDINVANAGDNVYARIDNSTQTYYAAGGQTVSVNGTTPTLGTINKFDSLINLTSFTTSNGNQVNQAILNVYNYTATGVYNMGDYQTVFIRNTGGNEATTKGFWSYNNTGVGAISRLDVFGDSTFNGGTYVLYGVK